ncbi:MAG: DNA primase [Anaerovibrio sp.]|uniref:DNA primase n=1 Tax=Anaerovibrio sp. TaxID=1872532 RepID=UPI0025F31AE3|nr:DNA primase [Anaerovibrio sp.]MCR5175883.1 DNA primase [Anaerovibrio sp.]
MAIWLPEEFVERVRSESDIVSVVSTYVQLKRRGNRYWGCCPFHQEDTPSFSVKPDDGFFYCFGCHAGGNIFKFISLIENVSYYDAIVLQAERLNIPLPEREKSPQELAREKKVSELREVHEMAVNFFHNCLVMTNYGVAGLEYFHRRGIDDETIKEFKLGFAPDAWDKLSSAFAKRNISNSLLLESGLAVKRQQGNGEYDRFRNRVMIPIMDERGRVCGFGGRIIGEGQPKYLNSPETVLFNKRRLLFGLDKAHRYISQAGFSVVVEGYMDVISVVAAGIRNVVASLGTAFTVEQCKKLLRYAPAIYFCYDSDNAGQEAIARAVTIAAETNAEVKVVQLPDGKDPDEFIQKHGAEEFKKVIAKAVPVVEFQLKHIISHSDINGLEGRLRTLTEMLPVLGGIKNTAERSAYVSKVAQLLSVSENDILAELTKKGHAVVNMQKTAKDVRKAVRKVENATNRSGRVIIRMIWEEPAVIDHFVSMVPIESLPNELHRQILNELADKYTKGETVKDIINLPQLGEEAMAELSRALVEDLGEEDNSILYEACVRQLRRHYLAGQYEVHSMAADNLYRQGDEKYHDELALSQKIKHEMDELQGVNE